MTRADQMRANALHECGEDYVWGAEGTGGVEGSDDYDCSGFVWAMFNDIGKRYTRTTANGFWHMSKVLPRPSRVGDVGVLLTSGRAHHIVLYIGKGDVVEAKGRAWGVVKTTVDAMDARGAHWAQLPDSDLGLLTAATPPATLRKYPGHIITTNHAHHDEVRWVQKRLNTHGFKCAVDGVFGPATASAVRAFKRSLHMLVNAKVGRLTWRALAK